MSATLTARTSTNSSSNSSRPSNNRSSSNGSSSSGSSGSSREKADLKTAGGSDAHSNMASERAVLRRSFDDRSRSDSSGRGSRTGSVTRAGDDSTSIRCSNSRSGEDTSSKVEALKRQCAEGARQRAALRVQLHAKQVAEIEQQKIAQEVAKKRLQEERQRERREHLQQRQRYHHHQQQEQQHSYQQQEQQRYYQQQEQQQKQMEWHVDAVGLPLSNRDNHAPSSSSPSVPVRVSLGASMSNVVWGVPSQYTNINTTSQFIVTRSSPQSNIHDGISTSMSSSMSSLHRKPELRIPDINIVAPDIYPSSTSTHTYRFAPDTRNDLHDQRSCVPAGVNHDTPYDPRLCRDDGGMVHPLCDIVPMPQRLSVIPPSPTPPPPPPPMHQPIQQQPTQQPQRIQQPQSHPTKYPAVNIDGAIQASVTLSEDFLTGATSSTVPTTTPMTKVISPTTDTSSNEEKGETNEERKENDKDILTEVSIVQRLIDEALFLSNWGST